MLNSFIKWAVKSYFGDLLEDTDCNKLSLGLLQGHVDLEDVTICRKGRILSPKFPLFVNYGHVDSLSLKTPLRLFGNESWFLQLNNVSISCSTKPDFDSHELRLNHRKDVLSRKLHDLTRLEDSWKVESLGYAKVPWAELASSLIYQIIRNISLSVTKLTCQISIAEDRVIVLHIDTISVSPDTGFSCRKSVEFCGINVTFRNTEKEADINICGPVNLSVSVDLQTEDETPVSVHWNVDSAIKLNFCPQVSSALATVVIDISALLKVFQLREDALLISVSSNKRLWWQHSIWLASCQLRRFSRLRFEKRLKQANLYAKAYHQWLKFEYVEIALKRHRDEVESTWPLDLLINIRRIVLDKFLLESKSNNLMKSENREIREVTSRSSSQGWFQSVSSWVGLSGNQSPTDYESEGSEESIQLLPSDNTSADEANKLIQKSVKILGEFKTLIISMGNTEMVNVCLQDFGQTWESGKFDFRFGEVSMTTNGKYALRTADNRPGLTVMKNSERSLIEAEFNCPVINLFPEYFDFSPSLIVEYTVFASSIFSFFNEQPIEKQLPEEYGQSEIDLTVLNPNLSLQVAKNIPGLVLETNILTVKSATNFKLGGEGLNNGFKIEMEEVKLNPLPDREFYFLKLPQIVCSVKKSSLDLCLSGTEINLSPQLIEIVVKSGAVLQQCVQSVEILLPKSHRNELESKEKRLCLNVPDALVTFDEFKSLQLRTSNVEFVFDSASSNQIELEIGSVYINQPGWDKAFLKGLPSEDESSFLSFETDLTEIDGIENKIFSLSIGKLNAYLNPQFLKKWLDISEELTIALGYFVQSESSSQNSVQSNFELVASCSNIETVLFGDGDSHLSAFIKDIQLLRSQQEDWDLAIDLIESDFRTPQSVESLVRTFQKADESCFTVKFNPQADSAVITTKCLDIFAPPNPIRWLTSNYSALSSRRNGQNQLDKSFGVIFNSENTKLRLAGDLELSVIAASFRGPEISLSNLKVIKSSIGLVLLNSSLLSISKTEDENLEQEGSVFKITSERVLRASWSVITEHAIRGAVSNYSSGEQSSSDSTPIKIDLAFSSAEVAILDPLEPKVEVARLVVKSPEISITNTREDGLKINLDAESVRINDLMFDVTLFETTSPSESIKQNVVPLSSSYPGVSYTSPISVNPNSLYKPLPPFPDFGAMYSLPQFHLLVSRLGNRMVISIHVDCQCSLVLTEKCLPTLLESCGMGAKMFPVTTTADNFGRPIHKFIEKILPSPDYFEFSFETESVTCKLMTQNGKSCFTSASVSDGVKLAFSSVPNVHILNGMFSAASLQLFDNSTEFGDLYSYKVLASGLYVDFTKSGLPDYDLTLFDNEFVATVRSESISYVHTKRIFVSILDFVDRLNQHRENLGKRCSPLKPEQVQSLPGHGARIDLKFDFRKPAIVVPIRHLSRRSLVIKLDERVEGSSAFAWQFEKGTNLCPNRKESSIPQLNPKLVNLNLHNPSASDGSSIFPCLINILRFDLSGVHVFDGYWSESLGLDKDPSYVDFLSYYIEIDESTRWAESPIDILVHTERNLDGNLSRNAPDFSVGVLFDGLDIDVSREQASRIFGLLEKNFGEDLGGPPPQNLPENMTSWKQIEVVLYAQNCRVNLFDSDHRELAGVRLDPAVLSFSRFSNNSKAIDFKWPTMLVSDIRTETTSNPVAADDSVFKAFPVPKTSVTEDDDAMQFELNYSANDNLVRIGFVLSDVRLVASGDFWSKTVDFISQVDKNKEEVEKSILPTNQSTPQKIEQNDEQSKSIKVSFHRCEFSWFLGSHPKHRRFLAEITAMLVMSPTRSLTLNIPRVQISKLTDENDQHGDSVVFADSFIGDIVQPERSQLAESTLGESELDGDMGDFHFVSPESEMRCEVALESLRFDLDLHLIKCLNGIMTQPASSESELVEKPSETFNAFTILTKFFPDLSKIKMVMSTIGVNFRVDSTPLFKVEFNKLVYDQSLLNCLSGSFEFGAAAQYHNAVVSSWEPLLETWKAQINWKYDGAENEGLSLSATSDKVLNLNVTSGLIELTSWIKEVWATSAYNESSVSIPDVTVSNRANSCVRPFVFVNKLEMPVSFTLQKSDRKSTIADILQSYHAPMLHQSSYHANPNKEIEFGDDYSQSSVSLSLGVKVARYQPITLPIPIDAVGIVVRSAIPETVAKSLKKSVTPSRIVFRVTLNKRRQKVIYAESAVRLVNNLPFGLALTFTESSEDDPSQFGAVVTLDMGESVPLPLEKLSKFLWFRPLKPGIGYCKSPIIWQHVTQPGLPEKMPVSCNLYREHSKPFFCVVSIAKRQSNFSDTTESSDPWHVITVSAPIVVRNLLPCDLTFELTQTSSYSLGKSSQQFIASDRLRAGRNARLTSLESDSTGLSLSVKLDQYPFCNTVSVMLGRSNLFVLDELKRPLRLTLTAERSRYGVLVIRIECSFWLYNNTNLPLVFRQHSPSLPLIDSSPFQPNNWQGGNVEQSAADTDESQQRIASGQSHEFEIARSVVPLMFSYDDDEWPHCQVRLGKGLHYPALKPLWSQRFSLVGGTTTRWLFASSSDEYYIPERCYVIGLEVEQGRGEYENTTFVTFTPRYQIVNHTSHPVCVAQHCLVANSLPPFDNADGSPSDGIVRIDASKSMPFHWWRADVDSVASVRMLAHGCYWSGAFDIDDPSSFHINMRDGTGKCHLLHVENISIGPMNCILLSDASSTPPPYRIDNFSEVPLIFSQVGTTPDRLRTVVPPKSSTPYALDEPVLAPKLVVSLVGGGASTGATYDLDVLGEGESLQYENFIFIQIENSTLVLDVMNSDEKEPQICFAPMQVGKRTQLWRMASTGSIQNEGISSRLVLDATESSDQNTSIFLKSPDPRRVNYQTWKFTSDGRLTTNAFKQEGLKLGDAKGDVCDALFGPKPGDKVVRKRLRPGSGVLCVSVVSDGPTRVLRVSDLRASRSSSNLQIQLAKRQSDINTKEIRPVRLHLFLPQGIGISLVSATEELAYITLKYITTTYRRQPPSESFRLTLSNIQVDNQLLSTPVLVLLFSDSRSKPNRRSRRRMTQSSYELSGVDSNLSPALIINASRLLNSSHSQVMVFKNLSISLSRLFIRLEERFLWKLLQLFGVSRPTADNQAPTKAAAADSRFAPLSQQFSHIVTGHRLYFASLSIRLNRIDLGVATASSLPSDLRRIKRAFRVPLIQFTGAQVELETFQRHHVLVTWSLLIAAIKQHYGRGFKSQAGKIFGSVDFLGSPLGLFTDVTEGLSGLIRDANVSGLVRHVMHGLSNSTAKFTSAMSETLGSVASDVHYQAERDMIRSIGPSARPSDHLVAGLVGFGHGVIGGVTSIFTHTYQGATQEGPIGLITGISRGVVGTITRPAAGFLDLAAGAAKAVSETARVSTAPRVMGRVREPRCTASLTGGLMEFSPELADAQQFLFTLSSGRLKERLLDIELLMHVPERAYDDLFAFETESHRVAVLVTTRSVYVVRRYADPNSVLQLKYDFIRSCRQVQVKSQPHVELLFSRGISPSGSADSSADMDALALSIEQQRSGYLIKATSDGSAQRIATLINCGKQLYERSRFFVSAAVILTSSDASLLYGYNSSEFGNADLPSEFD